MTLALLTPTSAALPNPYEPPAPISFSDPPTSCSGSGRQCRRAAGIAMAYSRTVPEVLTSRQSSPVIRKPEITKNASTPMYPPLTPGTSA